MNDRPAFQFHTGQVVVTSDGALLGRVEAETETHLQLASDDDDRGEASPLWLSKQLVHAVEGERVTLGAPWSALHQGVLALPPEKQQEYGSLGRMNVNTERIEEIEERTSRDPTQPLDGERQPDN